MEYLDPLKKQLEKAFNSKLEWNSGSMQYNIANTQYLGCWISVLELISIL